MKSRDRLLEETLREMAGAVDIPDNMWDHIRRRLDAPANVVPLPTARAHRPQPAAPTTRRRYPAGVQNSLQQVARLARVTMATAAVVAITLLPVAMISGDQPASRPAPSILAYSLPPGSGSAEQPDGEGTALGTIIMVRY